MHADQDAYAPSPVGSRHRTGGRDSRPHSPYGFSSPRPTDPRPKREADGTLAVDILKGAVAGAVGVWAMDRVDWLLYRHLLDTPETRRQTEAVRPGGMDPAHAMANTAAKAVGAEPPSPAKDNPVGLAVHYGLGIGPGAVYGALRGRVPLVDAGSGLLYGLGLFVAEDELANPLMGFAAPPQRYPWQAHARGLVAHLVYGAVTHFVLRALSPAPRRPSRPRPSGPARPRPYGPEASMRRAARARPPIEADT